MSTEQTIEFVPLTDFADYEILNQYPFTIRRKKDHYIVSESKHKHGYIVVNLNGKDGKKTCTKHTLIAKQFIQNDDPEHKIEIDHINHDRTDNRIENLRWVSKSENHLNRASNKGVKYEFIDDIPDEAIIITHYDTKTEHHVFNENQYYYYKDDETNKDIFYQKITDNLYRIMYINKRKDNRIYVRMKDINNKKVSMYIHNFKYQYGLD